MGRGDGISCPFSLAIANAHFLLRTKYGILYSGAAIQPLHNTVITPVEINGIGHLDEGPITANIVKSTFGKKNIWSEKIANALRDEVDGKISVFYVDSNENLPNDDKMFLLGKKTRKHGDSSLVVRDYLNQFRGPTDDWQDSDIMSAQDLAEQALQERHAYRVWKNKGGLTPDEERELDYYNNFIAQGHTPEEYDQHLRDLMLDEGDPKFSRGGIFTGSAANYDKPSLHYIGTGEGSQVYGWGLYGSTVRGVAEGYAQQDAKRKRYINFKGKQLTPDELDKLPEYQHIAEKALQYMDHSVDYAIHLLKYDPFRVSKNEEQTKRAIEWLERNRTEIKTDAPYLYEQTFFTNRAEGDESHLLKWHDAISDANWDRVIAQAEKEGLREKLKGAWWLRFNGDLEHFITDNGNSGDAIYESLSRLLGSPKAASEFLARAGIDGKKYPVDSFGGKGVKDGDEAGWNYVSFRDDNIRVDHKWVDGEIRFARGGVNVKKPKEHHITTRVFNPDASVQVVDGRTEPAFLNLTTAELRNYLRDKYMGREVTIDSDGTIVEFTGKGLQSALKKRDKHKRTLHVLDTLAKNAHYTRVEQNDGQDKHSHLAGQFVYTAALRLNDGVYGVELKLDLPKETPNKTRFKGQTVKMKIADAALSVSRATSSVALTSADDASAAESVRLGDIVSTSSSLSNSPAARQSPKFARGGVDVKKSNGVQPSSLGDGKQRYYEVKFEDAVDKIVKNKKPVSDEHVFISGTPSVFRDIGMPALPIMMNQQHVLSCYFGNTDGIKAGNMHGLGERLKSLPRLLAKPIMIIASESNPSSSVVAILKMQDKNGHTVITPVEINGIGRSNGGPITANIAKSAFGKNNLWSEKIAKALRDEVDGKISVFYVDNNEARQISNRLAREAFFFGKSELRLLSVAKGTLHSIADFGSPVKGVGAQIDSQQFKRWFANSKVVDGNGEPLVVYRGAEFDPTAQEPGKGIIKPEAYFTADPEYAKRYTGVGGKVLAYYLNIQHPFDIRDPKCLKDLQKIYPDHEFQRGESGALDWAEAAVVDGEFLKEHFGDKYDGIIYDEGGDPAEGGAKHRGVSYVPLNGGAQAKLAFDNIGTYDPGNDDARFARGGVGAGGDAAAVFIAGTRVAHDAGRGEDTPGAIAASSELSRQGETPLSAYGSMRRLSLPMSELVWLRNKLAGPFAPARLGVNADVFGIVDKTDMATIKAQLIEEGMFLCEDPEWVATHRASEVRDERKMSELALAGRLNDLADARVKGTAAAKRPTLPSQTPDPTGQNQNHTYRNRNHNYRFGKLQLSLLEVTAVDLASRGYRQGESRLSAGNGSPAKP